MIIVFGSNVLDQFFNLDRLPDADQAVHIDTHIETPGGKGQNQAIAAARAGAQVRFFGAVGDGGHGRSLIKNLQNNDINTSGVQIEAAEPTSVAAIFVDKNDGTHRIVVSQGANRLATQKNILDELLTSDTTLLLQAELNLAETAQLMKRARDCGCRSVILNLAPFKALPADMLSNIDILIMNEHEADSLRDALKLKDDGYEEFMDVLHTRYGITPVVTLGGEGAMAFDGENLYRVDALKIKAIDTVGAGDAFSGFLAAVIDRGGSLAEAMHLAALAGSITCTKIGAQEALPTMDDVRSRMNDLKKTSVTPMKSSG